MNITVYTAWREEYAAGQQAAEGAAVFLAGSTNSAPLPAKSSTKRCPIHGANASHDASECHDIGWKTPEDWVAICRKGRTCYKCFEEWNPGHKCPPLKCPACNGDHQKQRHHKAVEDAAASKSWTTAARSAKRQQGTKSFSKAPAARQGNQGPVVAQVDAAAVERAVANVMKKRKAGYPSVAANHDNQGNGGAKRQKKEPKKPKKGKK